MTTAVLDRPKSPELWVPGKSLIEEMVRPELLTPENEIILPGFGLPSINPGGKNKIVHAPIMDSPLMLQTHEPIVLPDGRVLRLPRIGGGAAGAWTFTNGARTSLLNGTFDIDSDTWKMALFLSTSNIGAASTTYAGLTNEHSNANGYTTGGIAITLTLSGTTTVTVDISTDPVWTASGGSITARFAVIYEVSGNVLCYCLLDSTPADVTATNGNTLTVAAHSSGVFTLA